MTWNTSDIPDQQGRTALVTGANTGIGFAAAQALAAKGARVLLGCRSPERAEQAVAKIRAEVVEADVAVVELDLSSLESVSRAAARVEQEPHLDLLINNAGIMGPPRQETVDGFESQIDPTNPDIVYAQSQYGGLVRFDKASGELVEQHYVNSAEKPGEMGLSTSSPFVAGGKVFLGSETGGLRCFVGEEVR